jgi:hypothetical protein
MAKTRRHKKQRGGDLNGNPASSWGWTLGTYGNGWTQFLNTFQAQPGQNLSTNQSNNLVPIKGGGKKHRHKKRGGNFVSQAAAPLVLLGLNQMAKTKKHSRHRRHSRRH